jgi:hypothetical protein
MKFDYFEAESRVVLDRGAKIRKFKRAMNLPHF